MSRVWDNGHCKLSKALVHVVCGAEDGDLNENDLYVHMFEWLIQVSKTVLKGLGDVP